MTHSIPLRAICLVLALACALSIHSAVAAPARAAQPDVAVPGPVTGTRVRLPNGWLLDPAGQQVPVGDFPLGLALSPDGRLAAVTHSGWHGKGLDLVELPGGRHLEHVALEDTWLGVTFADGGRTLAVAAGHSNRVLLYGVDAATHRLSAPDSIILGPRWALGGLYPQGVRVDLRPSGIWPTGLAADDVHGRLYVVSRLDSMIALVDVHGRSVQRRAPLGAVPYTVITSHDGAHLYVSLWSAASLAVLDAKTLAVERTIAVGAHPTDLVEAADGRIFVANANEDRVAVVDPAAGRTTEWLSTSADVHAPAGDTPNGLALDEADGRLYVANAGANHLAVFDVRRAGASRAIGYVPVGWYPTALRRSALDGLLVVANGKGAGSAPSVGGDTDTSAWCRYVSYSPSARGTLSLVPAPDARTLERMTRVVAGVNPAPHRRRVRVPVKHVFYIIKENRSYDQLFGDLPQGDGESSLCLFGERVTPNHHAIANEFVLLDRTYCESDGSADGHNWGMGAYATDYVIKGEPNNRIYDFEGGNPLAFPSAGYLWDLCARHGITYRSYGEFVFNGPTGDDTVRAAVPALEGHIAPHYRGYDTRYSDLDRYRAWLAEFDRYDRDGGLPQLSIIRLPNDHTEGTCQGRPTPRAMVAQNDLALGLMLERISHSRYWPDALVLVIEDDAANGQDHVDGHRTVALAAGPWVKRAAADHTLYTNCSVLRCIEDAFGLPPMSQFDARANGLENVFARRADLRPFRHREAGIDLDETNLAGAYGQAESEAMDFSVADRVPYDVLNRVLWHSTRGVAAPLPAPVRSGFALRTGTPPVEDDD